MATRRLRRATILLTVTLCLLLWLSVLIWFAQIAQDSTALSSLQNGILIVSFIGIGILILLIIGNLVGLIRDYRRHIPGARLKVRMVTLLIVISAVPLVVIYAFSLQFINRGIDNWFSLDIEEGLQSALELSRSALEVHMAEDLVDARAIARELSGSEMADLVGQLNDLRRDSGALELTIFSHAANDQILATSAESPSLALTPKYPSSELLFQVRQSLSGSYVGLEPRADGGIEILAAVNLVSGGFQREPDILLATFAVERQLSELVGNAEASYNQYAALSFLRAPLKTSLTATLSIVLLTGFLVAVYGAFFAARRLVEPIQQLMAGTRAVARGDFETQVPTPARDEIGFLVNAFNDMTRRLATASVETQKSQQQVEDERGKLEAILSRLSTGVVSFETDMCIRTANQSAGAILDLDLESHIGESLLELSKTHLLLSQFLSVAQGHLDKGHSEWREQIVLRSDVGRRVLTCACAVLPAELNEPGGHVVVFDDITALLQAQKDAAWGEVARRLAHEIKNPLTPIQLSAERLRRRYLGSMDADSELLDKATHTIIQQVEGMKEMVNAFSEYARTPDMELTRFDLNEVISEVADLYQHQDPPLELKLNLQAIPAVVADASRMRQVFHNLIRNALEAMENTPEPILKISTRYICDKEMELVDIKVEDVGTGFLKEIVEEAFDPYVTSKSKGTGLGLAIVKKLVEEHGGRITARNRETGGAEIKLLLPITVESGDELLLRARRREKIDNAHE